MILKIISDRNLIFKSMYLQKSAMYSDETRTKIRAKVFSTLSFPPHAPATRFHTLKNKKNIKINDFEVDIR